MNQATRTRIKICGITSVEDARTVYESGADAIGLVFYAKSPRNISVEKAAEICHSLPPFITSVGLFLNASKEFVDSVLAEAHLDLLQFHGSETPDFCGSFITPYIKAIGMKDFADEGAFWHYADQYKKAKAFLVDSHANGEAGGTGKVFDWKTVPQGTHKNGKKPIILAGGINPENIADAIQQVDVYGIDLSSGVESQAGIKDPQKIRQLMNEVQRVQCNKD